LINRPMRIKLRGKRQKEASLANVIA